MKISKNTKIVKFPSRVSPREYRDMWNKIDESVNRLIEEADELKRLLEKAARTLPEEDQ